MKWTSTLLIFSFLGLLGTALWFKRQEVWSAASSQNPQKEALLIKGILTGLERFHYEPKPVDDRLSRQVFHFYLKQLDQGKRFFTEEDIAQLLVFENELDDQARAGVFTFFDRTMELYDRALQKTQQWYREILSKPLDFSTEAYIEMNGDKAPRARNDQELRQRWELWLKYEVLERIHNTIKEQEKPEFSGEKKDRQTLEAEARQKTLEVYDRWFKRMQRRDRSRRLEGYLNAFVGVFDPHSGYFSPQEKADFDVNMSGKLEGIGARLQSDGEKTTVIEIVPGGPAWKQKELEPKDVILKVAQGDEEPVDVMGMEIDDVVAKIRGPKGTTVRLTVQKPDGSIKVISIVRDVVITEEAMAKSLILSTKGNSEKIGYIFLPKFYADFTPQGITSCAEDVAKEIEKLKREDVKGIILDLRNNGGGSLRDVVRMSGFFIESGPIVQVKSRNRPPEINEDTDPRVQYAGPLIVMVNAASASASEIIAAALQDYGRAVIVGAAYTYGKGTVQRFWDLDYSTSDPSVKPLGQMKVTIQKFYRITGQTTQLEGVKPDIVLPDTYNYYEYGERENEYSLPPTSIEPLSFSQKVYNVTPLVEQLKKESAKRVKDDSTFRKIEENAQRFRRQKEQTRMPVQWEAFFRLQKKNEEESKRFENMLTPIQDLTIANLAADLPHIKSDSSRSARNDAWLSERQKDIQLYEALRIMQDMIRLNSLASRK
ncbi:MAG: carboxy terminal-processing peptidase [Saprospiraceae bacterium]|nr:carboxy terminal-processing peptidase [Saprospiraceae bacterium]MDW8484523.1 carboxy terminal-processing peptidase [Saprospiraceae bacterium]